MKRKKENHEGNVVLGERGRRRPFREGPAASKTHTAVDNLTDGGERGRMVMWTVWRVVVGMVVVVALLSFLPTVRAYGKYSIMFNCKFSNEGCESDDECCSRTCVQAHPGTNHRCTRSSLHGACLYTYQCEERLTCGPNNTCCSKYWGTCIKDKDCCYSDLRCLEADGFYYKRCLMGRVDASTNGAGSMLVLERGRSILWRLGGLGLVHLLVLSFAVTVVVVEKVLLGSLSDGV